MRNVDILYRLARNDGAKEERHTKTSTILIKTHSTNQQIAAVRQFNSMTAQSPLYWLYEQCVHCTQYTQTLAYAHFYERIRLIQERNAINVKTNSIPNRF